MPPKSTVEHRPSSTRLSEADARGASDGPVSEAIEPELGNGPDDRIMERLIEPLNATVLVGANVQYRAGITLDELLAYEHNRFDAADADHDGEVSSDEARAWENSQNITIEVGRAIVGHRNSGPMPRAESSKVEGGIVKALYQLFSRLWLGYFAVVKLTSIWFADVARRRKLPGSA